MQAGLEVTCCIYAVRACPDTFIIQNRVQTQAALTRFSRPSVLLNSLLSSQTLFALKLGLLGVSWRDCPGQLKGTPMVSICLRILC